MSSKILLSSLNCLTELNSTELKQVTGGLFSFNSNKDVKSVDIFISQDIILGDGSGVVGDINQVTKINVHQEDNSKVE